VDSSECVVIEGVQVGAGVRAGRQEVSTEVGVRQLSASLSDGHITLELDGHRTTAHSILVETSATILRMDRTSQNWIANHNYQRFYR